jgi:pyruvate carboxylase
VGEKNIFLNIDHHQRLFVFEPEVQAGSAAAAVLSKEEIEELAVTGDIRAPFKGNVCEITVKEGQEVQKGDRVAIIEAMKMQTPLACEMTGVVASIHAKIGQALQPGDKILKIEPAE